MNAALPVVGAMAWMFNLPCDLVLVRHGEHEGNLYDKMKSEGKRRKLDARHISDYRLTDLGRLQAKRAGQVIKDNIGNFDRMYCSEYKYAVETAAHMDLNMALFQTNGLIREIDQGSHRGIEHPLNDHGKKLSELERGRWWAPFGGLGGESFADLTMRLRQFLDHLRENSCGLRVIVVCHSQVIRAFTAMLEDLKSDSHDSLLDWDMGNCHIRWYTRRESIGVINSRIHKVTQYDLEEPMSLKRTDAKSAVEEKKIERKLFSLEDLMKKAEQAPQILNSKDFYDEKPSLELMNRISH